VVSNNTAITLRPAAWFGFDFNAGVFDMLRWAVIFLIIGLIAGLLGFTGIAGASIEIAKILFFVFMVIFLVLLVGGLTFARRVSGG
jgi:uncharacterized membrane protein YtjA (UPF0391 family)